MVCKLIAYFRFPYLSPYCNYQIFQQYHNTIQKIQMQSVPLLTKSHIVQLKLVFLCDIKMLIFPTEINLFERIFVQFLPLVICLILVVHAYTWYCKIKKNYNWIQLCGLIYIMFVTKKHSTFLVKTNDIFQFAIF